MIFSNLGAMIFDDQFELVYELMNELEFTLRPNGAIYDPYIGNILSFNELVIIASTNPYNIHYAGQGEIELDVLNNTKLVTTLFGHYLKRKEAEGLVVVSNFTEEQESSVVEGAKMTRLTVRTDINTDLTSPYYHNKCLKYIWMMFALGETYVDLSNFDIIEEKK